MRIPVLIYALNLRKLRSNTLSLTFNRSAEIHQLRQTIRILYGRYRVDKRFQGDG